MPLVLSCSFLDVVVVVVQAKKLAVYVARANQQKAIEELMEELKVVTL